MEYNVPIMAEQTLNNADKIRRTTPLLFEQESYLIRQACFKVYGQFRNTQKEVVYQRALAQELTNCGLSIEREKQLPVYYGTAKVGVYIPDLVVNHAIVLELKAKPLIHKQDVQQFWYYLKNSTCTLGFLINFGEPNGVRIIRRVYDTARRNSASGSA